MICFVKCRVFFPREGHYSTKKKKIHKQYLYSIHLLIMILQCDLNLKGKNISLFHMYVHICLYVCMLFVW